MGINCSTDKDQDEPGNHAEKDAQNIKRFPAKLVKMPHLKRPAALITDADDSKNSNKTGHKKAARGKDSRPPQSDDHSMSQDTSNHKNTPAEGTSGSKVSSLKPSRQYDLVDAMDAVIQRDTKSDPPVDEFPRPLPLPCIDGFEKWDDYQYQRALMLKRENALDFDHICKAGATKPEIDANKVVQSIKEHDLKQTYAEADKREGYAGQKHARAYGDHFLSNVKLIEQTKLFEIAKKMPKGAHLHIHFNANLDPKFLINIAADMPHMSISSDIPLVPVGREKDEESKAGGSESRAKDEESRYYENLDRCKIQFHIAVEDSKQISPGNLFEPDFGDMADRKEQQTRRFMSFQNFRKQFRLRFPKYEMVRHQELVGIAEVEKAERIEAVEAVDRWLCSKLVFDEREAHNMLQTADGAWEKFNARTQMMKGLFNYERAYREYTLLCLEEFRRDNIQYAEIRPNFMPSNQLWTDDGKKQFGNDRIIDIIIEVCEKYAADLKASGQDSSPELKIIYCTPRSFEPKDVEASLEECLQFKLDKKRGRWIAGFDLVGEESKGRSLLTFAKILLEFKVKCFKKGVDIPFLFHCGETLDIGTPTDQNLLDALLLGSKRIGHGFALARHPYIMEQMKKRNVCLEVCPISSEILGLTPRISGHSMYNLLANNVHCTVNTDNGALFRSTLSHDFYQVFAGKADMTLHGWRQLIEWSIEHACMTDEERKKIYTEWKTKWEAFCLWIWKEYKDYLPSPAQNGEGAPPINEGQGANVRP